MSKSCKKSICDQRAVFDGGDLSRGGIGHNQGPALDEPEPDIDTQSIKRGDRRYRGPQFSDADRAWLRQAIKSGQLEKITWDSPYGSKTVEDFERRMAAGVHKREGEGKSIAVDGLVSRRGYRRIIHGLSHEEQELRDHDLWILQEVAKRVLHGRNATIFEKLYINPLIGEPKGTIDEVMAQFNIKSKRVYNILDDSKQRVTEAIRQYVAGVPLFENERRVTICPNCGKHQSSKVMCPRGRYTGCYMRPVRPRVLPARVETAADIERKRAWYKQELIEEARRESKWREYVTETLQKWEALYGPKIKVRTK